MTTSVPGTSFRLATFNVHQWGDANYKDNYDRVLALTKKHKPDVICLQESGGGFRAGLSGGHKGRFGDASGLTHYVCWQGCAIYSRFKFNILYDGEKRKGDQVKKAVGNQTARFAVVELHISDGTRPVYLTCLHLDHRLEPSRLTEINLIHKVLSHILPGLMPSGAAEDSSCKRTLRKYTEQDPLQIWTGDFNALTKEDYSDDEWATVKAVRETNNWEPPKVALTSQIKDKYGMVDCWEVVGKPRPIKTCRFDTRIDYVYASPALLDQWQLVSVQTVEDTASDHNMVIATFNLKERS